MQNEIYIYYICFQLNEIFYLVPISIPYFPNWIGGYQYHAQYILGRILYAIFN